MLETLGKFGIIEGFYLNRALGTTLFAGVAVVGHYRPGWFGFAHTPGRWLGEVACLVAVMNWSSVVQDYQKLRRGRV